MKKHLIDSFVKEKGKLNSAFFSPHMALMFSIVAKVEFIGKGLGLLRFCASPNMKFICEK